MCIPMTCIYARLSVISCIIVDSTRRGKSMPDALSKSLPIWIAVWNRMLFPDNPNACQLKTPKDVVPPSEHSQIEVRLDQFLAQLTVGFFTFMSCQASYSCAAGTADRPR